MDIEKKIVEEATSKAYSIMKDAKEQRARALREEESKLKKDYKQEIEQFEKLLSERKKEELASARLESKRIIDNAYEEKFRESLDMIAEEFKSFRKTKEYSKWLNNLLKKAVKELGETEGNSILHLHKGDKKLVKTKAKVVEDLDDLGGLILERKDGKVRVNYSFSQILESSRELLREKFMREFMKK